MPTIRTLFVTMLLLMLIAYGGILYIGSFSYANNITPSNIIAGNYTAISGNSVTANTGIFVGFKGLSTNVNSTGSALGSYSTNPISSLSGTVTIVAGFFGNILTVFYSVIGFVAIPFTVLGLPLGFAEIVGAAIILGVIGFALLSAIFLFPI